MTVESERDLRGLMRIGQICANTMIYMAEKMEPGMTTEALDQLGAEYMAKLGARSAPILVYRFPGHTCISVNDEVAHGIPGKRVIKEGDLVNIDVCAELEGYIGDTGGSFAVPPVTAEKQRLLDCTKEALAVALKAAQSGVRVSEVGRAIENYARSKGYKVIRELGGHGVGRKIHEKPSIPNHYNKRARDRLTDGLVVTLEPFLNAGKGKIYTAADKWTLKTVDGSLTAQFEHTIVVNGDSPLIMTIPA